MYINVEKLRNDLINYYGSASLIYPYALINVSEIENASIERLIEIAYSLGFNLSDYEIQRKL